MGRDTDIQLTHLDRGIDDGEQESVPSPISTSRPLSRSSSTSVNHQHDPLTNHPPHTQKTSPSSATRPTEVRRHGLVFLIFLLYAVVAILSWTFTCLLTSHPMGASTWDDQWGNLSVSYYQQSDRLRRASNAGLSIIAAIGIPVTSAIAARAAAAYCQQNSSKRTKDVTMRQMLALADKGWSGYESIRDMLKPQTSKAVRTPLLVFAASLIITGRIITRISSSQLIYLD